MGICEDVGQTKPCRAGHKVLVYRVGSSVWLWEMSEVLACLTQGLGNREIASTLKISMATVRSHISHLLPKLDATNRTQAVVHANGFGMLGHSRRERNQ